MAKDYYFDDEALAHLNGDNPRLVLWRELMKHHMDVCHAAGLDAVSSANLLLNGAAYLLGASLSEQPERRQYYTREMIRVFRAKVEQAVSEGRQDRGETEVDPMPKSWLDFKAKHDEPDKEPCPFCGIRHTPAKSHPYCDMAARFKGSIECHNQSGIGAM